MENSPRKSTFSRVLFEERRREKITSSDCGKVDKKKRRKRKRKRKKIQTRLKSWRIEREIKYVFHIKAAKIGRTVTL